MQVTVHHAQDFQHYSLNADDFILLPGKIYNSLIFDTTLWCQTNQGHFFYLKNPTLTRKFHTGFVEPWIKPLIPTPASWMRVQFGVPAGTHLGWQRKWPKYLGSFHPCGRPKWSSRCCWPQPGQTAVILAILGVISANRSFLSLSLCLFFWSSAFQINKPVLFLMTYLRKWRDSRDMFSPSLRSWGPWEIVPLLFGKKPPVCGELSSAVHESVTSSGNPLWLLRVTFGQFCSPYYSNQKKVSSQLIT